MKVTLCCLVVVLVAATEVSSQRAARSTREKRGFRSGAADRFSHGFGKRTQPDVDDAYREKRGFRSGAADRFSHGFGKRTETETNGSYRDLVTVKDVADLLQANEKAATAFVQKYLDLNNDGYITPDELMLEQTGQ